MEDSEDLKLRFESFSQTHLSETPRASVLEPNSEFLTSLKSRPRPTSFISPQRLGKTQSFLSGHTRSGSTIISPPAKTLLSTPAELRLKESSYRKLDEKLGKIAEEINTERLAGRDTGIETYRDRGSDTLRELYASSERSTMARGITDEWELNEIPTLRWCAYCKKETMTDLEFRNTAKTFWSAVGIFLLGGVLGCFLIPYSMNRCKDTKFVCHVCKHEVSLTKDN
jgi:hypothetical protein